ncbi:MAG: hypothetical protein CSA97_02890, partial [Bacteroidetes bacterium]
YEASLKIYRDWKNTLDTAHDEGFDEGFGEGHEKGMEEGLRKGMEKGREAEKKALALSMLAEGMTVEVVSRITGLSEDFLRQL